MTRNADQITRLKYQFQACRNLAVQLPSEAKHFLARARAVAKQLKQMGEVI